MDLFEIRRNIVAAMCSDDILMEQLVLKGGNALAIAYNVDTRTSMDVDYSISGEFDDIETIKHRIARALETRFLAFRLAVIDFEMTIRPPLKPGLFRHPKWGGYLCEFKLIRMDLLARFSQDPHKLRMNALNVDVGSRKIISIDISQHEYCAKTEIKEIDGLEYYVYAPVLLCAEKLRAICQQFEEYPLRGNPTPRARDFFDIHVIVTHFSIDIATEHFFELLKVVFHAKEVPLEYLWRLAEVREFHRSDWAVVEITAKKLAGDFDWYFDFILFEVARLKALWVE